VFDFTIWAEFLQAINNADCARYNPLVFFSLTAKNLIFYELHQHQGRLVATVLSSLVSR
jgi:hypothetical protein